MSRPLGGERVNPYFKGGFHMNKRYYLAYGSNLNVRQMCRRCPSAKIIGTAVIADYELLFKGSKTGSYLTIEPKAGKTVPVAVWSVNAEDEKRLDAYEGYPTFYYKKKLEVTLEETGKEVNAFVYIMDEKRPLGMPSPGYVQVYKQGYEDFGFDKAYVETAINDTIGGMKNEF